jgi:hypothetical protein
MKRLLLLTLATATFAQAQSMPSEESIRALLSSQLTEHLHIVQQAATAFGVNPQLVEICPVLQEEGLENCKRAHGNRLVLHIPAKALMQTPSLMRYNLFAEVYMAVQINKSPLVRKKKQNQFLKQMSAGFATAGLTVAALELTGYAQKMNLPLLAASSLFTGAITYKLLADTSFMPLLTPEEEKSVIKTLSVVNADTEICKALIAQGPCRIRCICSKITTANLRNAKITPTGGNCRS